MRTFIVYKMQVKCTMSSIFQKAYIFDFVKANG